MVRIPKKGGAFIATVRVLVKEEACENNAGACDWFSGLLSEHPDVVDWAYVKPSKYPQKVRVPEEYEEGDLLNMHNEKRVSDRETATIIAALRKFQENPDPNMDHFNDVDPLSSDEIDELCQRLNR